MGNSVEKGMPNFWFQKQYETKKVCVACSNSVGDTHCKKFMNYFYLLHKTIAVQNGYFISVNRRRWIFPYSLIQSALKNVNEKWVPLSCYYSNALLAATYLSRGATMTMWSYLDRETIYYKYRDNENRKLIFMHEISMIFHSKTSKHRSWKQFKGC